MVDLSIVETILVSGIGGLGVRAVVSLLKRLLRLDNLEVKARKIVTLALTLIVCAGATAAYLVPIGFGWGLFAAYTAFVFAASQGWYRATQQT